MNAAPTSTAGESAEVGGATPPAGAGDAFTLREALPAEPFLPTDGAPWWWWVAGGLVVLGLVVAWALWWRARRRPAAGPDLGRLGARAVAQLAALDPTRAPPLVATEISLVLRRFLADAWSDPALFETHEEFIARAEALAGLPAGQREPLAAIFDALARIKYGPPAAGADPAPLLDAAARWIGRVAHAQPEAADEVAPPIRDDDHDPRPAAQS